MEADNHELAVKLVEVFRALGDQTRLRMLGLIAERSRTGTELAEAVSVGAPTISHHIAKLVRASLVTVERSGQSRIYSLNQQTLRSFAYIVDSRAKTNGETPSTAGAIEASAEERERAKVIRDFFDGERLKQIPAQRKKRVIVLQQLLAGFKPEHDYTEREVSEQLRRAHEDFATLRRELVDYGFMTREGGVYRVALVLPKRSMQVSQEITGDESAWLRRLLASTVA